MPQRPPRYSGDQKHPNFEEMFGANTYDQIQKQIDFLANIARQSSEGIPNYRKVLRILPGIPVNLYGDYDPAKVAFEVIDNSYTQVVLLYFETLITHYPLKYNLDKAAYAHKSDLQTITIYINQYGPNPYELSQHKQRDLAQLIGIVEIPTVLAFSNGKIVGGFTGEQPESGINDWISFLIESHGRLIKTAPQQASRTKTQAATQRSRPGSPTRRATGVTYRDDPRYGSGPGVFQDDSNQFDTRPPGASSPGSPLPQQFEENKALLEAVGEFDAGHDLLENEVGYILGARGQNLLRHAPEAHCITIGRTGAGKGTATAIANLMDHRGSAFSVEIGGATIGATYNFRKTTLGQKVFVFDPLGVTGLESHHYNPLDDLDPENLHTDVQTLVRSLAKTDEGKKEEHRYFQVSDIETMMALIIYAKLADEYSVPKEDKNLVYLSKMFSKFPSQEWNDLMDELRKWKGEYARLLNKVGNYLYNANPNDENKNSIVTSASGWLTFLTDDKVAQYLTRSDFSMRDLRDGNTTIYMVMESPDHYKN